MGEVLAYCCLESAPVEVRNAEGGGKSRVEEAAGVARHEDRALLRVGGHVPGGEAGNLGAREVIVVAGRCAHGRSRAGPAQPKRMLSVWAKQHLPPILEPRLPS